MIEVKTISNPNLIKETLNRIGFCNKKEKKIYPSVYLYEKDGVQFLIHFKEFFLLTRKNAYDNINKHDENRVNYVASLLKRWGLIDYIEKYKPSNDKHLSILKKDEILEYNILHKIKL